MQSKTVSLLVTGCFFTYFDFSFQIARVVKSQIRLAWRQKAKTARYITDLQCKQVAAEILNLVFSQSKQSKEYWAKQIKPALKEKFFYSLFSAEESNSVDIWTQNDLGNRQKKPDLLTRIQELTGSIHYLRNHKCFGCFCCLLHAAIHTCVCSALPF
jgi:hypothetical protein